MGDTIGQVIFFKYGDLPSGKQTFSIGNTSSNGGFSIAMLDYRRVFVHF